MGNLGFDDFKEQLQLRMGGRTDMESFGDSSLNYFGIWINNAYIQLCTADSLFGLKKKFRFPQLETSTTKTTTDGVAYISEPSDILVVREIYDSTNNSKLDWIPWSSYIGYTDRTTTTAEGDPREWTRSGGYIYLHPTPDATMTMTIFYKKIPEELTGSSTTIIGPEWDEPILQLSAYKGHVWLGELDRAKVIKEEFLETVAGIISIYDQEESARNEYFRPDPGYWRAGD